MSLRIVFLARSLGRGGAERQLIALAKGLHERGHRITVATFYPGGDLAGELDAAGVRRVSLNKSGRWDAVRFAWRLRRFLRAERPEIVHTYLPPANVAAALIRPVAADFQLVWGVRATFMDLTRYDWFARAVDRVERRLAQRADLVIANAQAGIDYAVSRGFPRKSLKLVRNGIDTQRFAPQAKAGADLRAAWGIDAEHEVVGLTARLDPIKDHETFLEAFQELTEKRPGVRGALLGDGQDADRARLQSMARKLSIEDKLLWLPFGPDPAPYYSAFDVACSSSVGEGFSNALAEAMACGVSCVATDVGDTAEIVGDTGLLVPPKDPGALARALAVQLDRRRGEPGLGAVARQRIEKHFSLNTMVSETERLLATLIAIEMGGKG